MYRRLPWPIFPLRSNKINGLAHLYPCNCHNEINRLQSVGGRWAWSRHAASRFAGACARVRRQFNQPVSFFEGVEEALARIAGKTYQMEAARRLTLAALDAGERPAVISAIVNYHLTERYRQVVNDAMDVQGGTGICLGPRNLLGRAYQGIPISITVEGAPS
jgi:alkylation response protein AidB-like acyl-CoA dehydrogenase